MVIIAFLLPITFVAINIWKYLGEKVRVYDTGAFTIDETVQGPVDVMNG